MDKPQRGYWCECWTEDLAEGEPPELQASFDAYTAPQADRWVAIALRTISPVLDADSSDEAWVGLYEERVQTRRALTRMQPCTVSVTHAGIRITWTLRPVLFVPLAHRHGIELPACADDFKSQQTLSDPS
ncbi:hypothetical protein BKI49_16810 [Streptomyces sp. Tue6028]|uniref:hypothetical protein n=1 Tax=Streptomyces sp. Tue6028 TaxID=2036037 RepID=UPI000BB30A45|nr:hypothetical protein [Streptomyces sp. Tue6028]PBC63050.1 hypothetical protein BKI49_16810 [Streptomyces sp. Tue6028]